MKIGITGSCGTALDIDTEGQSFTADGLDTLLRQVVDAYEAILAAEISAGVIDVEGNTAQAHVEGDE